MDQLFGQINLRTILPSARLLRDEWLGFLNNPIANRFASNAFVTPIQLESGLD
jgi:hypothetical protein